MPKLTDGVNIEEELDNQSQPLAFKDHAAVCAERRAGFVCQRDAVFRASTCRLHRATDGTEQEFYQT